jgi:16S rRNA (guanine966-N2)-methyltransferase
MRIVAGAWRGRALQAPRGDATRPTADRVRQALFDMLLHAPWGGREVIDGARVLDGFAGTGALGLEALSRGAAVATFVERDRAALAALRTNIESLAATTRATILAGDILAIRPGPPCSLVFLDPPYGQGLAQRALGHLTRTGWIAAGALIVVETGQDEAAPGLEGGLALGDMLAERVHGVACVRIWRASAGQ